MTFTKIAIYEDKVKSSEVKSPNIINLTSLTSPLLQLLLQRIDNFPTKVKFLPLTNHLVYSTKTGKPIISKKFTTKVTFVVDDDDISKDIKIKNIVKYCKVTMVTRITIMKPTKKNKVKEPKTGTKIRLANYHHTNTTLDLLSATTLNKKNYKMLSSATIVNTNDDRAGSIASMLMLLNNTNIYYTIERFTLIYNESWLTTKRKITNWEIVDIDVVNDNFPEGDKFYSYKSGYGDLKFTEKGVKKWVIRSNKKQKALSLIERIINWISTKVKTIINKIVSLFDQKDRDENMNDKVESKLAYSLLLTTPVIASNISANYVASIPKNASADIKKANKVISDMQINKMLSRSGISGDKTLLNSKRSHVLNSYIANTTSYNTGEAIVNANNLAVSNYKNKRIITIVILLIIIITTSIINGTIIIGITSVLLCIVDHILEFFDGTKLFYVLAMLNAPNIGLLTVTSVFLIAEMFIKDSKTLVIRSILYSLLTCLTLLL